ncbi:uncharacterized protein LOC119075504 [Bradysia coprophila]|uniref:uncharacterized protein LOC119075504 n=1 Tax=Bradysia coprophila TaxID=38358 RepID=UPI00187D96DF|nr:uncharacterized protein LOC119075504 [Bradysia coprophila]
MGRFVVILLFGILYRSALAKTNFWNNEVCTSDRDCSGLTSCDLTFGCTLSGPKVGLVMLGVFLALCALLIGIGWLCRRHLRWNNFRRPHNQYLPQTVVTTNTPAWNQQPMGMTTTTVYPHNPNPNQFYADSVNPPAYNPYLADPHVGPGINVKQMPTAPYPPAGYS